MEKHMKREKNSIWKVIISIAIILIIVTAGYFTYRYFAQEEDFKATANLYFMGIENNQQIGKTEVDVDYNYNCSHAIEYPMIGKEEIDNQIKQIIDNLKQDFQNEFKDEDIQITAEELFAGINYHQYIGYETFLAPDNNMSLVLFESKMAGDSNVISEKAYTYNFSLKTGKKLENIDIFKDNYKQTLADYTKKYFKDNETYKEILVGNFEDITSNKEENFNKYIITNDKLCLYYDKYEILPGNYGIFKVEIPYKEIQKSIKIDNKKTQEIPSSNTGIESQEAVAKYTQVNETVYAKATVNVREADTTKSEKVGVLIEGSSINRIAIGDNGWSKVKYKEGIAYISSSYLSKDKPVISEPKNVEITVNGDRKIDPSKPMVALTFDDGPNPKSTNRILDTLEKYNVVATFFDLGSCMANYPKVVQREEALGCEVGSHTYSHKNLNSLSSDSIKSEVEKSDSIFKKVLGHKPALVRPPYGNANSTVKATVPYPLINWDIDTLDWKSKNVNSILSEIHKYSNYDGRIILMHSIYKTTADAVEKIVPELISKGYQLVTVSELAKYKGASLQTGKVYYHFR